jgi:hypothetical protein
MGSLENRVRAEMLSGCRKGGPRPPRPVAGIQHMRDRARSAVRSIAKRRRDITTTYNLGLSRFFRFFVPPCHNSHTPGSRFRRLVALSWHVFVARILFLDRFGIAEYRKILRSRDFRGTLCRLFTSCSRRFLKMMLTAFGRHSARPRRPIIPTTIPMIPMQRNGSGASSAPMPFSATMSSGRPTTLVWSRRSSSEPGVQRGISSRGFAGWLRTSSRAL